MGALPRRGTGRSRLRPAQAGAAERDHRPLCGRPADVRRRGARHREHGDARRLRHRGAEEAVAGADAEPGHLLGVLDDRTAGRIRPEPVQDTRGSRWRRVGDQRREVVHLSGPRRRHPLRDVHERHVRRAAQDSRASRSSRSRATTTTSSTATSAFRSTTCSVQRTAPRRLPSAGSAAAASTTRCARSPSASWPST